MPTELVLSSRPVGNEVVVMTSAVLICCVASNRVSLMPTTSIESHPTPTCPFSVFTVATDSGALQNQPNERTNEHKCKQINKLKGDDTRATEYVAFANARHWHVIDTVKLAARWRDD